MGYTSVPMTALHTMSACLNSMHQHQEDVSPAQPKLEWPHVIMHILLLIPNIKQECLYCCV